jgi:hypothetical protein
MKNSTNPKLLAGDPQKAFANQSFGPYILAYSISFFFHTNLVCLRSLIRQPLPLHPPSSLDIHHDGMKKIF